MRPGRVIWITGLAGSGKTTFAKLLLDPIRSEFPATVLLDGDRLRSIFSTRFGHASEDRCRAAHCYGRLCKELSDQGIGVVCATISMFDACREWNRREIADYVEIYLDVPMDELRRRDKKYLYSRAERGEIVDVVGIDIPAELPKNPDLVLLNDGRRSLDQLVNTTLAYLEARRKT